MLTATELERISYITDTGQCELYAELATKDVLQEAAADAVTHIEEAMASIPSEDFLQDLIDQCRAMSMGRVTKAEVAEFCKDLEELQDSINRDVEYAADELRKAKNLL